MVHYMAVGNNIQNFSGEEYSVDINNLDYEDEGDETFVRAGLKNFTFTNKIDYQSSFIFEYKIDMKILGYNLYHTSANSSAYNNWKFTSSEEFDKFYYDSTTKIIIGTWKYDTYTVGVIPDNKFSTLSVTMLKNISTHENIESSILGIPYKYSDIVDD